MQLPNVPQSNGFAESMVQTVENILQKCDETKDDPYLALLFYRATPLDHQLKSPAELLTNRKFNTRLPLRQRALLKSTDHEAVKIKFITREEKQVHYYNQNSGPSKKPLETNQLIRMYDHHSQTWEPGNIIKPAKQPRSYQIQQNRCHLSKNTSQLRPDTASVSDRQCQRIVLVYCHIVPVVVEGQ